MLVLGKDKRLAVSTGRNGENRPSCLSEIRTSWTTEFRSEKKAMSNEDTRLASANKGAHKMHVKSVVCKEQKHFFVFVRK